MIGAGAEVVTISSAVTSSKWYLSKDLAFIIESKIDTVSVNRLRTEPAHHYTINTETLFMEVTLFTISLYLELETRLLIIFVSSRYCTLQYHFLRLGTLYVSNMYLIYFWIVNKRFPGLWTFYQCISDDKIVQCQLSCLVDNVAVESLIFFPLKNITTSSWDFLNYLVGLIHYYMLIVFMGNIHLC